VPVLLNHITLHQASSITSYQEYTSANTSLFTSHHIAISITLPSQAFHYITLLSYHITLPLLSHHYITSYHIAIYIAINYAFTSHCYHISITSITAFHIAITLHCYRCLLYHYIAITLHYITLPLLLHWHYIGIAIIISHYITLHFTLLSYTYHIAALLSALH
jgi:hypothetical protein